MLSPPDVCVWGGHWSAVLTHTWCHHLVTQLGGFLRLRQCPLDRKSQSVHTARDQTSVVSSHFLLSYTCKGFSSLFLMVSWPGGSWTFPEWHCPCSFTTSSSRWVLTISLRSFQIDSTHSCISLGYSRSTQRGRYVRAHSCSLAWGTQDTLCKETWSCGSSPSGIGRGLFNSTPLVTSGTHLLKVNT